MSSGSPIVDRPITRAHLSVVRVGPGANCSSIGSVVDTLFVTGVAATAILAAVLAALRTEPMRVVREEETVAKDDAEPSAGRGTS